MPYRIAAPPEAEPPETDEPYVAVLRAQERRTRIGAAAALFALVSVGALAFAAPRPAAPNPAESAAVRHAKASAAIARARARAASEQARFESGVRAAIGEGFVGRPDLGACPIVLPSRPSTLVETRAFPLLVVDRVDVAGTLPSQAVAEVLVDVGRAEAHVAADRYDEASLYARALDAPDRFRPEVVLVATTRAPPAASGAESFRPGAVAGRAYLYDHATSRVVCAADVEAKSSEAVAYSYLTANDAPLARGATASMTESLERDLDRRLERAIADAMKDRAGAPVR